IYSFDDFNCPDGLLPHSSLIVGNDEQTCCSEIPYCSEYTCPPNMKLIMDADTIKGDNTGDCCISKLCRGNDDTSDDYTCPSDMIYKPDADQLEIQIDGDQCCIMKTCFGNNPDSYDYNCPSNMVRKMTPSDGYSDNDCCQLKKCSNNPNPADDFNCPDLNVYVDGSENIDNISISTCCREITSSDNICINFDGDCNDPIMIKDPNANMISYEEGQGGDTCCRYPNCTESPIECPPTYSLKETADGIEFVYTGGRSDEEYFISTCCDKLKCSDNVDRTNDIVCNRRGYNAMIPIENSNTIEITTDNPQEECCINRLCSGNYDSSFDTTCSNGEQEAEAGTNAPYGRDRSTVCCDLIDDCSGHTLERCTGEYGGRTGEHRKGRSGAECVWGDKDQDGNEVCYDPCDEEANTIEKNKEYLYAISGINNSQGGAIIGDLFKKELSLESNEGWINISKEIRETVDRTSGDTTNYPPLFLNIDQDNDHIYLVGIYGPSSPHNGEVRVFIFKKPCSPRFNNYPIPIGNGKYITS
ncbi:MAG: hypothetical protein CMG46_00670, partial [Candidatus Marinimicrobia bacterium]|nr:hypothetical protein [Candidatus Neomarinimicrobiota bacterium]